ncbi:unnamed protein product [Rotaria sp. Silwood1]|nr:unnamed protein product [Rotaria sp. Silwood1]CAF4540423.1 unnamed protein product [Rotaria sp. Silwood1]
MGTDSKTAVQQPSSKVTVVESKNDKKKKSKRTKSSHHKSKHSRQQRSSSSSSSNSSIERGRNSTSRKKRDINNSSEKGSKDKTNLSSTVELRNNSNIKSSNKNKNHSNRSKDDSPESPYRRNHNTTKTRSRSRSRSRTDQSSRSRSSDRSHSHDSSSRHRHKNSFRHSDSNLSNVYSPMPNFIPNMNNRYSNPSSLHSRGGRVHNNPSPMMGNPSIRNNNSNRSSLTNFRGHMGSINNAAYLHNVHNMANMIQNMSNLMQQKQRPGSNLKYSNANYPNNRFYQQFHDNYKKLKAGEKISNLYQASFPLQHIPRDMRFNFRLLGRNRFTASDDDEDESTTTEKRSQQKQQRHHSSSKSSDNSDDERREEEEEEEAAAAAIAAGKLKSSPMHKNSTKQKYSSTKSNRNRTSSSTKPITDSRDLLTNPNNLSTLLAGIMQSENAEIIANTLASAAVAANNKRERTKKYLDKKVQKFKNYARFQQTQSVGSTNGSTTNSDEMEKKIHGLARRLQTKTLGLHEDYELQGMKRSDDSNVDSDTSERHRRHSSNSASEPSKDKDIDSDGSTNSQRQRKFKKLTKKTNSFDQIIGQNEGEHLSDGNDSDASMLNLNDDLKPIGFYIKDHERMLHEMFRCVRGHKLQAILPDALKTRSIDEIKARCLDQLDILSKKRIRAILLAQPMTSSSGTEDSTDEDEQDILTLYPHLKSSLDLTNNNAANVTTTTTTTTTALPTDDNKKSLPNSKFRPVQMHAVTNNSSFSPTLHNNLAAPSIIGANEDVNDYYEDFKKIKKLTNLRRNEQDDELTPFPDQNGKILQPIGTNLLKFEFKPITSLTNNQQAHFNARRIAYRQKQQQQQQQNDIRQEIDDLLNIDNFVLPDGERPLSSTELSINKGYQYGLPPKIQHKIPAEPPRKGSLGDLLKRKKTEINERSPSPIISKRLRHRQLSHSLSSSSERTSRRSSCEMIESNTKIDNDDIDMSDLSKLLDLNEEDELLLLQIEVEQEERNLRRQEKRKRKEEKKKKKNHLGIIKQCLNDLLVKILAQEEKKITFKRPFDDINNFDYISKKIKIEDKNLN